MNKFFELKNLTRKIKLDSCHADILLSHILSRKDTDRLIRELTKIALEKIKIVCKNNENILNLWKF